MQKSWQHPKDFPSGPPPQYYPGPAAVNFGVLKRSGVFATVWPPANEYVVRCPVLDVRGVLIAGRTSAILLRYRSHFGSRYHLVACYPQSHFFVGWAAAERDAARCFVARFKGHRASRGGRDL